MLENYEVDDNGVIRQINRTEFTYDEHYVERSYNTYGQQEKLMSALRLGYVIGSLGHIPDTILDVGYGNGAFLNSCKKLIPHCFGSDIPPAYPLPEGVGFIEDIYSQEFECVTFFDSLEHFDNIYDIKNLKAKYIVISVPCCHYVSDEWFLNWKHRKPNEHLWHFNDQSLINFFSSIGYQRICNTHIEDAIRKPSSKLSNILTATFKKI